LVVDSYREKAFRIKDKGKRQREKGERLKIDEIVKSQFSHFFVIPAKAGIQ
jgi:hypothetical protein